MRVDTLPQRDPSQLSPMNRAVDMVAANERQWELMIVAVAFEHMLDSY